MVECFVGQVEPGGPLVVEVGQGALFQFFLGGALGVEPAIALFDELLGRLGDEDPENQSSLYRLPLSRSIPSGSTARVLQTVPNLVQRRISWSTA